ncbi:hypothetical protein QJS10_CPA06g00934 [Acorus calamus]|uniref:Uncharacterized protein n=1 Tax=Acorus calamus TaxID=4465 RepID=A0AAV9EJR4_ACOCL|nr:hypothetical protein QJS10_CPA06g00934 [Acorus calamus]
MNSAARETNGGGDDVAAKAAGDTCEGGGDPHVWPKFEIGLSNKEKEEDFLAFRGSKLPLRPKKRSKFLQRTLSRRRGLKAIGALDSDSES